MAVERAALVEHRRSGTERVGLRGLAVDVGTALELRPRSGQRVGLTGLLVEVGALLKVRRRRLRTGHTGGCAHVGLRSV